MGRLTLIKAALMLFCSVGLLSEALALPDCSTSISELAPCLNFVQGDVPSPPPACCDGLKTVIATQPVCLCELLSGNLSSALPVAINVTLATELPGLCNVTANTAQCSALTGTPSSSPLPSGPGLSPGEPSSDASRKIPGTILNIVQFAAAPVLASLLRRLY